MAHSSPDGFTRTIGDMLLDPGGAILACVVTTDHESFHSALNPIPDIATPMTGGQLPAAYQGSFWLTGLARFGSGPIYACDAEGNVHDNAAGSWRQRPVSPGKALRAIECLPDGTILTGGTSGEVFRSRDGGVFERLLPEAGSWINAFAGTDAENFVVAADDGVLLQWQGGTGRQIDLATDVTLNAAFWDGGSYLVAGAKGLLLRGSQDAWDELGGSDADLFGIARYGDEIWLAAGPGGVLRLVGDELAQVRKTFVAHRIRGTDRFAAFAGDNLLFRHDGAAWPGYRFG